MQFLSLITYKSKQKLKNLFLLFKCNMVVHPYMSCFVKCTSNLFTLCKAVTGVKINIFVSILTTCGLN